ncbi:MAG: AAA family ATPase, partial [Caldilineaceae bacterium]|nr:AAA family ATPase [Caldilineaceae bacterium]
MLVLLTGLPGSGKSHLARALASALHADVLDRDAVRDAIFPARDLDYSAEQNELASQVTYQVAEYILRRDPVRTLILDGRPFSKRIQVEKVVR